MWAIVYALRLCLRLGLSYSMFLEGYRADGRTSRCQREYRGSLDFFAFAWFIIGNSWVFSTDVCPEAAPQVYNLCYWLVIINYVVFCMPCLVLVS